MNFFMEVAKLRAARALWSRLVREFDPQNPKSLSLRTHCQTSGWSLTAQDVFNNVGRTCIEAMAATQGHTQSLHTNALDEAIALPTDFSARIARNTQLLLQQESGTTGTIDPWAGSYYVERLTHDLAERAWAHIQEAERAGGMAKAIEQGIPKMRIEEAAARTQARIDSGAQKVIGVNTYRLAAEDKLDVLKVDNDDVYRQQIAKLERLRAERDDDDVRRALEALTRSAERGAGDSGSLDGNLLALAVDAARAKATVGEISDALEKVYGRHQAMIRTISGVFRDESGAGRRHRSSSRCSTRPTEFEEAEGRRPRILVAKMGQDGHDRGQKVIVSRLRRHGLRRRRGAAVLHARGGRPAGGRRRRAHRRRLLARRRPPHAAAGAQAGARRAGPPRHHGRDRRRDPARRRADAQGDGRGRGVPARHRDRRVRARPAGPAAGAARRTDARRRRARRGHPRGAAGRDLAGDHAGRVDRAASTGEQARELLTALAARTPPTAVRVGISGRARASGSRRSSRRSAPG